jgi:predicted peptidase
MMRRREILSLAAAAALGSLLASPASAQEKVTGFLDKTVSAGGTTMSYVVYVPRDYTPDRKWPVILFLHGSGERGTDGLKQSQVGLGGAVRLYPERYPAIVVMPQCAPNQRWSDTQADLAMQALDRTVQEYHGDPDRLYLTGLSMGGAGSWYLGTRYPEKFAAVVSLCGGGDIPAIAEKLAKKPVWVFVGDQDRPQTVEFCRNVAEALKSAGSTTVKLTVYPGVPHNCWDKAYAEKDLTDWLFAQKK